MCFGWCFCICRKQAITAWKEAELPPYIKIGVDENTEKEQYFLTLYSLSQSEPENRKDEAFLPSEVRTPGNTPAISEVFEAGTRNNHNRQENEKDDRDGKTDFSTAEKKAI